MRALIIFSILTILITACNQKPSGEKKNEKVIRVDSFYGPVVADTIIYDVIIHNTNPEDAWAEQSLQYVKQNMLVDSLFSLVYQGKVVAFDFFEKKPLSIADVKKLEAEKGFDRENIGKIQFTERWYFDAGTKQFQKEVMAIVLGYDLFDADGKVRGYKPVFKLSLNH
jgi:hypothetical protein